MSKEKKNRPYVKWNGHHNPFVSVWLKIVVVIVIGISISALTSFLIDRQYQANLKTRVESFALSVDAADVLKLKDASLPDDSVPYQKVKNKLEQLKDVYSDSRFVYIMDDKSGVVRFLADSEPAGSDNYSPRLEVYDDATDALRSVFITGVTTVEGPVSDDYGMWYSSLAPIKDADGKIVAIIGVDVPASHYFTIIGGISTIMLILTFSSVVLIYFYDRQRNRRFEAFRHQVELMSIASHELRTPLSGIRWGQEVLLGTKLDDVQQTMTQAMYDSTLQLQESIEDILQLASMGSGKPKKSVFTTIDVAELVDATLKVQQLPAQQKELTFSYQNGWVKPMMIRGDAVQLRRVFNNIVSNAIKYASIGSTVTLSYEKKDNAHLIIIKNQGIGVPQKELAHIFDGFYRASNAIEKQVSGTGMGLYLSRQTVEKHGGKLWIESVENDSTTAFVELPAAEDK